MYSLVHALLETHTCALAWPDAPYQQWFAISAAVLLHLAEVDQCSQNHQVPTVRKSTQMQVLKIYHCWWAVKHHNNM